MYPTPETLAAAWDFLRTVEPVKDWKLPPAEQVEFRVTKDRNNLGAHTTYKWTKEHIIYISASCVSHCDTLLRVLAHEMVHAAMAEAGNNPTAHNRAYLERAIALCFNMGWDPKAF